MKPFLQLGKTRPVAIALALAIGLCGWAFLAAATFWPGFAPAGPRQVVARVL